MKYKSMWQAQKKMTLVFMAITFVLLFLVVILILDKTGSMQLAKAKESLTNERMQASAQIAQGYDWMYQNKPVEYAYPEDIQEIVRAVFGDLAEPAMEIAWCESRLNPKARNSTSTATGLFQIMSSIHGVSRDNLENPVINTIMAKKLYDNRGNWGAWEASKECHGYN